MNFKLFIKPMLLKLSREDRRMANKFIDLLELLDNDDIQGLRAELLKLSKQHDLDIDDSINTIIDQYVDNGTHDKTQLLTSIARLICDSIGKSDLYDTIEAFLPIVSMATESRNHKSNERNDSNIGVNQNESSQIRII